MTEAWRKATHYGTVFATPSGWAATAAIATRQHTVASMRQLAEIGLSSSTVRSWVTRRRLHRIHHGVYSLVPRDLLTREGHWLAAVLACGPGAVLSHRTAAALHELRRTDRVKIDVTVTGGSHRNRPGIDIHRSTTLNPSDITTVNGIPCTTVARTLLDLAGVVHRRALERAFDQAEILEVLDLRALRGQLARNHTRPAAKRARSVLDEHFIGTTATQSELEEAFLAFSRRAGFPGPLVNEWIDLGDGEDPIRADFVWRDQRVIVETDGYHFHRSRQARERDTRRDQRVLLAGWRSIRTTSRQVTRRPHELEATLAALLDL
jgi:predicted transcriptional regulator of viral defense system